MHHSDTVCYPVTAHSHPGPPRNIDRSNMGKQNCNTSRVNIHCQILGLNIKFPFYSKLSAWKKGTSQLHYEVMRAFQLRGRRLKLPHGEDSKCSESKYVLPMRRPLLPWRRLCHLPQPDSLLPKTRCSGCDVSGLPVLPAFYLCNRHTQKSSTFRAISASHA